MKSYWRNDMPYNSLRPYSCRPQMRHTGESPDRSPYRGCENELKDKTECAKSCQKLKAFQKPRQVQIDHHEKAISKLEEMFEPKVDVQPKKPPRETACTLGKCKRAATRRGYKNLYPKPLCESCWRKLYYRMNKYGSIRDPKTGRL
jgi:hypothetical protein